MDRVPRERRMGRGVAPEPEPEPAVSRQIRPIDIDADWVGWRDAHEAERVAELAPEEVWRMWVSIMRMTHSYDDIMSRVENTLWNYGDIFSMNGTIGTAETESLQRIYPEEYAFLRHHPSCTITRMEMSIAFEIMSTPELVNCMMEHIGRPPFISIGPEPPAANRTRAPTRRIRK